MSADIPQDLFPVPAPPPSRLSPFYWPGITHESTEALRASLKENHEKFHIYFNRMGFHNHLAHYVLSLWAMGADAEIINAAHKFDSSYLLPAFESPEAITAQNFKDHLGDENFYGAYVKFFTEAVRSKGIWAVIEEHIFDQEANFDGSDKEQPEMLSRFLEGLIHPMIHAGYGFEFGLPGIVVEGLASTAIHKATATAIIPASLWASNSGSALGSLTSRLPSALTLGSDVPASKNVHAFTILARILEDPGFAAAGRRLDETLNKYANEWSYNSADPKEVERKIEELVWTNVIIYGIAGWTKGEDFNSDFVYMHLVTSVLFLSSITANIKPASQELLLRSYFVTSLSMWIGRGRPSFDIAGFFTDETAYPSPPGPFPTPNPKSLPSPTSLKATTPNPWFPIIQASLVIPDEHLPKLQRALAHFGSLYGIRAPGQPDFANTELPGAEKLDGSLFIRTAGLAMQRLFREKDMDVGGARLWDQKGFFKL